MIVDRKQVRGHGPIAAWGALFAVGVAGVAIFGLSGCRGNTTDSSASSAAPSSSLSATVRSAVEELAHRTPVEVLVVWAEAEPDEGPAPLTVKLSCDPIDDVDNPRFEWDPGDGSPRVEGQTLTHTYRRPGTYVARVTVTDPGGNRGEDTVEIQVEPRENAE